MAVKDMWHRTLVYFGMADEPEDYEDDYEYDDEYEDEAYTRRGTAQDDLERGYKERPNVRRLGPRRGDEEFDDIFTDDSAGSGGGTATAVRPVQSRKRETAEVHLVIPKSFNDAQQIADKYKTTVPVILNLQGADTDLAKRLIDFSSGLTYALDGGMQRVADKVFMLTPRNVDVSAEERARLLEKGFFNQY
jgi:cell division inhibitor SepF